MRKPKIPSKSFSPETRTRQKRSRSKVESAQAVRVTALAASICLHKKAYYNSTPLISDAAFDALEDELRRLDPEHPVLLTVGTPVDVVTHWEKARHAIAMSSLNKVVTEDEFRKWASRCDSLAKTMGLNGISSQIFVTEKLDGISLAVTYEKGMLAEAITRGDGQIGERITPNVVRMKGVPQKLKRAVSLTVRGEIVLRLSDLTKAFPDAVNSRNQASGTSKRFDGRGCEHLTVMFYDLDGEEYPTEEEKFARLRSLGFTTPYFLATDLDGAIAEHCRYAKQQRAAIDYEIDGLVMRANDTRVHTMLGEVGGRPRGAVAFKFASQAKVTEVIDIIWDTGSTGRVSPVALVKPVFLAGATVQRASLANASRIAELGIGIGDEVLVSRRNDVIPYVETVVRKIGPTSKPPVVCDVCKTRLHKVGEYLCCRNQRCPAIVAGRIQNWVDEIGVLEWGEGLIAQLVAAKLVKEPADLYQLTAEQIASLERRGMTIAKKVLKTLKSQLPLSLPTFLAALGIENVGLQTTKAIVAAGFDSLQKVRSASVQDLATLPGIGPAKAKAAINGLKNRSAEIDRLLKAGVVPIKKATVGQLVGKSFCFTGALSKPRKELEKLVDEHGGSVLSGVTKDLDYLVMEDPFSGSSKAEKAAEYGTECLNEKTFLQMLQ